MRPNLGRMTARFALAALILFAAALPGRAQEDAGPPPDPAPAAEAQPLNIDAAESQRKARLGRLFDSLATAENAEDAKRYEQAIDRIWTASGSPTADLLMTRADEMMQANDAGGALTLIQAALDAKPDFAEGWNRRATLFFLRGDYVSAMAAIRETLRHEPRHYGAWAGLGRILQTTGDDQKALDAYRRALAIHPHLENLQEEIDSLTLKLRGHEL